MSRSRSHTCLNTLDTDTAPCGIAGDFAGWSDFSACSSTCPGAIKQKFRDHTCTNSRDVASETCFIPEDNWGTWREWSSCSSTCTGTRSRDRFDLCDNTRDTAVEVCSSQVIGGYGLLGPHALKLALEVVSQDQDSISAPTKFKLRNENVAVQAHGVVGTTGLLALCHAVVEPKHAPEFTPVLLLIRL